MAATDKIWGTDDDLTWTLASLAEDPAYLTGRESTVIVSSSETDVEDYLISGSARVGSTTPTAGDRIEIWLYAQIDDAPTYPCIDAGSATFDGTDSSEVMPSREAMYSGLHLVKVIKVNTTADEQYTWGPFSVVDIVGELPERWGLFLTHGTGGNLHATAANSFGTATPVYRDVT